MSSATLSPTSAIEISNLKFTYPAASSVLCVPKWSINKGEHVFLSGPSGSGKSTLLNLLCGTLTPTSGNVQLLGHPFSSLSGSKRDKFRATHIGVVFQQFNLIPYLTVSQNIKAAVYFAAGNGQQQVTQQRLSFLLNALQLPENMASQRADSLSVGQQQRVAIARALINEPEILIVDEPTSALDTASRDKFMQLLKQVSKKSTMLFVSHDPSLQQYFDIHTTMDALCLGEQPPC